MGGVTKERRRERRGDRMKWRVGGLMIISMVANGTRLSYIFFH